MQRGWEVTKDEKALINEIKARATLDKFIMAVLKEEALKLDMEFMDMGKPRLPTITPETLIILVECECCGRLVKVPRYVPGYETPNLAKTICPFCGKPLRLNIPLPGMVQ